MDDRREVTARVTSFLAELISVDPALIQPDTPLMGKELGVESLVIMRFVVKIEKEFGPRLRDKDITDLDYSTIGSIVDFIVKAQ